MTQQEIQERISRMPYYSLEKAFQYETRLDHEYLYFAKKGKYSLVRLADISYFYVTDGRTFHIFNKANQSLSFEVKEHEWVVKLFIELERACPAFRNTPSTFTPLSNITGDALNIYHLDRSGLTVDEKFVFKKGMKTVARIPAQKIIGVDIINTGDDTTDTWNLAVYTSSGKRYDIVTNTPQDAYELALKFKDNLPHLICGPAAIYADAMVDREPALVERIANAFRRSKK